MTQISVIIATYNSGAFILSCLDSVFKQAMPETEIILIDNASKDNTVSLVRKKYPQIKIIENKINFGASRARNQGLTIAKGLWILTLDCDVILEAGFFKIALETMDTLSPRVGSIQPKILNVKKTGIYSVGIRASFLKRFHDIGRGQRDSGRFNRSGYIFGACCAAALYRSQMLREIKDGFGYFDERFFFLFEDADLSWRAQKKGWRCLYRPELRCLHHGNSSLTDKNIRQYLSFINRLRMIRKNQNPLMVFLMVPLYLIYDLPRFLILIAKFKLKFPEFK